MFFDIHAHMYKYQYPTEIGKFLMSTPEQVAKRYAENNITGAAILPILGPELYVPQSVGEVIDMANESGGKYVLHGGRVFPAFPVFPLFWGPGGLWCGGA